MSRLIDLTGKTINYLTVLRRGDTTPSGKLRWYCRCACGTEVLVHGAAINSGHTKSCGCHKLRILAERCTTHGMRHTAIYGAWKAMHERCTNPSSTHYADYGGRGIRVCPQWKDFAVFYSDMGDRPAEHTLDRRDNNGDYTPGNCRWATYKEQGNNKRNNRKAEYRSEIKTLAQWAESSGVPYHTLYMRLYRGMTIEQALTHNSSSSQS